MYVTVRFGGKEDFLNVFPSRAFLHPSWKSKAITYTTWDFGVLVMENFIPASMVWDVPSQPNMINRALW